MRSICEILEERISRAIEKCTGQPLPAIVQPAKDPKFGDYQANGVMGAAKKLKMNPRELAAKVVEAVELGDICETPEIAGPGFINLRLKNDFVCSQLAEIFRDAERLGIEREDQPRRAVVDFSGPNIAKQMHVGHLRSTILGDAICRMLEFAGHEVIRQNHIGDWGTQFGMLIAQLKDSASRADQAENIAIEDLEEFYRTAKERFDSEGDFENTSREEVVRLHNSDPETMAIWSHIVDESRRHYQPVYDRLGVNLTQENERGESFYRDKLASVVEDLKNAALAEESEGAICVFPEGFTNKEGNPLPFIIQKSDGAYLYATTDLAALRFRVDELGAGEIIYVTDARQKLHFEMLFATARKADWANDKVRLDHVTFGTVLGEDNRPFKTRSGDNVKLNDLLDEAVTRARQIVEEKNPQLDESQKQHIANAVGIGAIKYADFSNNRTSDYVFSFDRMLAMEGNTAPYMQYAYARIRSIERKAQAQGVDIQKEMTALKNLVLTEEEEFALAKKLLQYGEAIQSALSDFRPNLLTGYLYDLAGAFSGFYNTCPVLGAKGAARASRLVLCDVTARTLEHGLWKLLGIEVVEQM